MEEHTWRRPYAVRLQISDRLGRWRPERDLLSRCARCLPGGLTPGNSSQTGLVLCETDLPALYQRLNHEFFQGELPLCCLKWSRRLTRTAGNIRVQTRLITLSVPLLHDVWKGAPFFEVCGVRCTSPRQALVEILKHEMIHLWLFEQHLPCGHTREFRRKAKQIGQPKTRHGIALPPPKSGWVYECATCKARMFRRRRLGRRVACALCCRQNSGGDYDERFRLRGRRLKNEEEVGQATR